MKNLPLPPRSNMPLYLSSLLDFYNVSRPADLRKKTIEDLHTFWNFVAKDLQILWDTPYTTVIDDSKGFPFAEWFIGGQINITTNCIDAHRQKKISNQNAIHFCPEIPLDPSCPITSLTYHELLLSIQTCSWGLYQLQLRYNIPFQSRMALIMPLCPQAVIIFFAIMKLGHVVIPIFSGYGEKAIQSRLKQSQVSVIFYQSHVVRKGVWYEITPTLSRIITNETCILIPHPCKEKESQDIINNNKTIPNLIHYKDFIVSSPSSVDTYPPTPKTQSEDLALILYTSGTTAEPKGTRHTHAGTLLNVTKELRYNFNVDERSHFFWFTDLGWMMGPWEIIGTLYLGGTLCIFEGAPIFPTTKRLWDFLETSQVTHFGLSPTLVRTLRKYPPPELKTYPFSSLQYLGSTGETWDEASYRWFYSHIGRDRCPIMNISGGTEIMGCFLMPLPIEPLHPLSLGGPALGADIDTVDASWQSVDNSPGFLVAKNHLPSMTRGFEADKDHRRYLGTYFKDRNDLWFHGDIAEKKLFPSPDGQTTKEWFLIGRGDDTIKIAGKRVAPSEMENILLAHDGVSQAAVLSAYSQKSEYEIPIGLIVLSHNHTTLDPEKLIEELHKRIDTHMGHAFRLSKIFIISDLPKTRSQKIMRGLIKKILSTRDPKAQFDVSSIDNPESIQEIKKLWEKLS